MKKYRNSRKDKLRFTKHDLLSFSPLTESQSYLFDRFDDSNWILEGYAGTGKTFSALYLSLYAVLSAKYDRLIIIRSPLQTRSVGFTPGTLEEKAELYEAPYSSLINSMFNYGNPYLDLKSLGYVDFMLTSFIRGLTFDNSIILFDEAASSDFHELDTVLTRVGSNSKIIVSGDVLQSDLRTERNGLNKLLSFSSKIPAFDVVKFKMDDIVRSGFVRDYIIARDS